MNKEGGWKGVVIISGSVVKKLYYEWWLLNSEVKKIFFERRNGPERDICKIIWARHMWETKTEREESGKMGGLVISVGIIWIVSWEHKLWKRASGWHRFVVIEQIKQKNGKISRQLDVVNVKKK